MTARGSIPIVVCLALVLMGIGSPSSAAGSDVVIAFSHCCGTVPLGVQLTDSGAVRQVSVGGRPVFHSASLRRRISPAAVQALVRLAHTSGFFSLPSQLRLCTSPVAAGDSDSRVITVSGKTVTKAAAACPSRAFDQLYAALLRAVSARAVSAFAAQLSTPGLTLASFAGTWVGHTRDLTITRTGNARESIYTGCCDFVIAVRFQLSRPKGTRDNATATATVTAVRIGDKSVFTKAHPPPHVGEARTLRLHDGVIAEPLTGTNYCSPKAKHWVCGA